jgi:hypothetical protein
MTKKATFARVAEKLRREKAVVEGNNPDCEDEEEEAQL